MTERRYYYNGMYGTCAAVGFGGAYMIFLGTGVILPMFFLALALVAAVFARSSFAKRRRLLEEG